MIQIKHTRQLLERDNVIINRGNNFIINQYMINHLYSYGVGFMYTTALPPDKISAAL